MRRPPRVGVAVAVCTGTGCGAAGVVLLALDGSLWRPDALHVLMVGVATTVTGLMLLRLRPQLPYGAIVLANGIAFGITLLVLAVLVRASPNGHGGSARLAFAASYLLVPPLNLVWELQLICFPDGRFPSRRWKRWVIATSTVDVVAAVAAYLTADGRTVRPFDLRIATSMTGPMSSRVHAVHAGVESVFGLVLPVVALVGLVVRMRRATPIVRQQMKWLVTAMVAAVVVINAFPATLHPWHGGRAVGEILLLMAPFWIQAAIATSIFRYHLWGIDVALSKAITFATASAAVSVAFVAVALGAGALAGGLNGRLVVAEVVIGSVLVASRIPRRRLEEFVRRLIYGERPHGYAVLNGLGRALASAVARGELGLSVADAVCRALSVRWAETWRIDGVDGRVSSIGAAGRSPGPAAIVPAGATEQLTVHGVVRRFDAVDEWLDALGGPDAAVVIRGHGAVLGLVACGERPGEPLEDGDLQLLEAIAREVGLVMENQQLTSELAARVRDLERQTAELQRSRERLAQVQDEERRRISRDLHDGVQQQLVAVTAKLRRLSARPKPDTDEQLGALADEAEAAVFGLQDLARGIYPSVLTDRGLGPALGAQAERMPADVALDIEPDLVGNRFDETSRQPCIS